MFQRNRTVSKSAIKELGLDQRITLEAQITDSEVDAITLEALARRVMPLEVFLTSRIARYVFDFFGPIENKVLLDIGCGYVPHAIIFAKAGARVYACDVSPKAVATIQRLAEVHGVADRVTAVVCPAEALEFPDAHFDLVFGYAVLHHIDVSRAGPEIARVLKPGGKAGFLDPLGHNVVLEFARDRLSYKGKSLEKGTDLPLHVEDIEVFGRSFSSSTYRGFQLVGLLGKLLRLPRTSWPRRALDAIDTGLFRFFPWVQRYARYVGICVTK